MVKTELGTIFDEEKSLWFYVTVVLIMRSVIPFIDLVVAAVGDSHNAD